MAFVAGISFEHVILCDQTNGAFGKKNFVSELYRGSDLAALDQIGMWFENRVDLLGVGNLLAPEYTAACLIDHSVCQAAVVLNLFSQLSDSYVSEPMPMSSRYLPIRWSRRCAVVIRWISYIRRRAERVRSRNPLIRRRSSSSARRPIRRVTTRTASQIKVLSVG